MRSSFGSFKTTNNLSETQKIDEARSACLNNVYDMTEATARGYFLAPGMFGCSGGSLNRDMDPGLGRCLSLAVWDHYSDGQSSYK